jgi:hypothetical protein
MEPGSFLREPEMAADNPDAAFNVVWGTSVLSGTSNQVASETSNVILGDFSEIQSAVAKPHPRSSYTSSLTSPSHSFDGALPEICAIMWLRLLLL